LLFAIYSNFNPFVIDRAWKLIYGEALQGRC
jgi:hypothetical protein